MGETRNGGARPGAGRKPSDSEEYKIHLCRNVRVKFFRIAATMGFKIQQGKAFWSPALDAMMDNMQAPDPEYLRLTKKP